MLQLPVNMTRAIALCAVMAAIGCDRKDKNSPVATNSPSGASTAPSSAAAGSRDNALVRVVDATPDSAPVDLFADGNKVFDNLDYKKVTPYKEMDGQRYSFEVKKAGATTDAPALAKNSEGVSDGDYYTVFVLPGDGNDLVDLKVVTDDQKRPDDGKARIRVVNATRDKSEVDVFAPNSNKIVGGVNFQTITSYSEIDPVSGDLELRKSGEKEPLAKIAHSNIEAGKSYTVVLIGAAKGKTRTDAFVIEDQMKAATAAGPVPEKRQ